MASKVVYRSGFCGIGLHEGTSPTGISGIPLKVCVFWIDCGCECHVQLTELFELTGRERTPQQNPKWDPPKSPFVMPSAVSTPTISVHTSPSNDPESPLGTDAPEALERAVAAKLPPPVARSFAATATGRAARGELETWVRIVTDEWMAEVTIDPTWRQLCTPPYIAKEISRSQGVNEPSTGAITSVLDRWTNLGFAASEKKPIRFVGYTEEGIKVGLDALKRRAKTKPTASHNLDRVTAKRKA